MKCSFGFSDFLEEISSLSHSVVFLYFFALIVEEGFHISSCYSLEPCIQMLICFPFLFSFAVSFSSFLLPWFMDLTFQVPMQYCSLQHQILLLSPLTSTTRCCFCFGTIPSFFLKLFLHWSPVSYWELFLHIEVILHWSPLAYWAPLTWGVPLSVSYHFAFSYCSWGSQGKNTEVVAIPFSSGPRFVRTLHHDLSILGGPTQPGS